MPRTGFLGIPCLGGAGAARHGHRPDNSRRLHGLQLDDSFEGRWHSLRRRAFCQPNRRGWPCRRKWRGQHRNARDAAPPLSASVQSALTGTNGQILVGTGGFGFASIVLGGDCTFTSPNIVCTKTGGVNFGPFATQAAPCSIAQGCTGQITATLGFQALAPVPTRAGDVIYWNGSAWVTLAGNNSGTQTLTENSSGVPSWSAAGSGSVTSVTCGTGLSGGTFTTSGTFAVNLT